MHRLPMVARLQRRGFGRSVLVLAGGAAGAQVINAAASPILTRLYTPFEIGQLGLFLAFMYVASVALSLRFEQAVVVPKSDEEGAALALLALGIVPFTALAATLVLVILGRLQVAGFETLPAIAWPLAMVGLVAFGVFGVVRYWLIRLNQYRAISEVQIAQSLGRAGGQALFGVAGFGLTGLLLADVIGRALGLARMLRAAGPTIAAGRSRSRRSIIALGRRYWRFPVLGVPSSLLNAVAFSLPVPLLAAAYSLPVAGYFALVQRVLGLPMTIIGSSVADALLARMSEHAQHDPSAALPLFRRTAGALAAIGIPIALVVALFAPPLFAAIFGEDWRMAGQMAAIMSPWYLAALVVSPLSRVALVYQGQAGKLVYDVVSLAGVLASLIGGAAMGLDALEAIGLLSVLQIVAYAVYFVVLYRLVTAASAGPPDGDMTSGEPGPVS
jgi:O-antigen/teichoic acid export membrane protein